MPIRPDRGTAARAKHGRHDGAASPYLGTAAVLQDARLGMVNNIPLPVAEEPDCLESQSTDRHVPNHLGESCAALAADSEFMDAMGRESAEQLLAVKHFEWEKYCEANPDWESKRETVTDWELKFYTPFI